LRSTGGHKKGAGCKDDMFHTANLPNVARLFNNDDCYLKWLHEIAFEIVQAGQFNWPAQCRQS
jgi:hypothetical protein